VLWPALRLRTIVVVITIIIMIMTGMRICVCIIYNITPVQGIFLGCICCTRTPRLSSLIMHINLCFNTLLVLNGIVNTSQECFYITTY
jgi:hypothetical protein